MSLTSSSVATLYKSPSRCVLDKRVVVGDGAVLGCNEPQSVNLGRVLAHDPDVLTDEGLTVVGKDTEIPPGFECTRPVMIDSHLVEDAVRQSLGILR